jgi:hypothetical protein
MLKPATFVDTSYIIALFNPRDKFHLRARTVSASLAAKTESVGSVTTEAVLTEIGNAFSKSPQRIQGTRILKSIREDPTIDVISVTHGLFDKAVNLYVTREDKEWGLTDCISFVVMREREIVDVLTTDHHFEQAGFRIVL